jgi:hypothetical protein
VKEANLHITDEEMQLYIKNQLTSYERQRIELEIQLCEVCLELFIHWNSKEQLPHIPQVDDAAEQIMSMIEIEQAQRKRYTRRWIQRPLAQVVVAASITLLLVGSGAMSVISSSLSGIEDAKLRQQLEQRVDEQEHTEYNRPVGKDQQSDSNSGENDEKQNNVEDKLELHQPSSERWLNKASNWLEKIQDIRFD